MIIMRDDFPNVSSPILEHIVTLFSFLLSHSVFLPSLTLLKCVSISEPDTQMFGELFSLRSPIYCSFSQCSIDLLKYYTHINKTKQVFLVGV